MRNAVFEDARLAAVYDPLDPDRSDLDFYVQLVDALSAHTVLDVGCGTGTFACRLAGLGVHVVAVDPSAASLDVARAKPGARGVTWLHGDATSLPPLQVDLATMTANVAQVFVDDDEWAATLRGIRAALRPEGHLVFETRVPEARAWETWDPEHSLVRAEVPGTGPVRSWEEVTTVEGAVVSFRSTVVFERDGTALTFDSSLRFRTLEELAASLREADLAVLEVRDAPDRPGREHVVVARRGA